MEKQTKQDKLLEYITGSIKLFILYIPFLIANLSYRAYQVVDDICTYSLGSSVILALSTFLYLKQLIDAPFESVKYGFLFYFARSECKNDLQHQKTKDLVSSYFVLRFILLILTTGVTGLLLKPTIHLFSLSTESAEVMYIRYIWTILWLIFDCFNSTYEHVLKVQRKQKLIFYGLVAQSIINITGDLLSIQLGWGLNGVFLATFLSEMIKTVFYHKYTCIHFYKPKLKEIKKLILLGKDMFINRVLQRVMSLMIGYFCSMLGSIDYLIYTTSSTISDKLDQIFIQSSIDSHLVYTGEYLANKNNKQNNLCIKNYLFKGTLLTQTIFYCVFQSIIYIMIFIVGSKLFYFQIKSEVPWTHLSTCLGIMLLCTIMFHLMSCFRNIFSAHLLLKYTNIAAIVGFIVRVILIILVLFIFNHKSVYMFAFVEPIDITVRLLYYIIVYVYLKNKGVFTI